MQQNLLLKLQNEVKNYSWGSKHAFKKKFNIKNDDNQPQAEIWMGAHPAGCSTAINSQGRQYSLDALVSNYPEIMLSKKINEKFHCLPFLLKVLAADSPLSIQVHPKKSKAKSGFNRENNKHISLNAFNRNYKDTNHKPELVYALTPFQAMNGFRPIDEIIYYFTLFNMTSLWNEVALLRQHPTTEQLKIFLKNLMTLSHDKKSAALSELKLAINTHVDKIPQLIKQLAVDYPNDIGLFMPMILNVLELKSNEAMYLHPETPHAYLKGLAVEIMASSDNVLRAGLTSKHIDVTELLKNTRFAPKSVNQLLTAPIREHNQLFFPVPVDDFKFSIIESNNEPHEQAVTGPEILFCLSGNIMIKTGKSGQWTLTAGESIFVAFAAKSYCYVGKGDFVRAYV